MFKILFATAALAATSANAEFCGALVHKDGVEQKVDASFYEAKWTRVEFPTVDYDTCGLWNSARNEFVIPDGVSFVRLSGQIVWKHGDKGARQVLITKNNGLFAAYPAQNGNPISGTTPDQNVSSAVLKVSPGDTFQLQAWQRQTEALEDAYIYGNFGTWFSMEVIE